MQGSSSSSEMYDAVIVGGGPGGTTAALVLARAGLRVIVLEKAVFPRFHIGESLLPRAFPLLKELGLEEKVRALPHIEKFGAEFGMGDDAQTSRFTFDQGLLPGFPTANLARASFDELLLNEAKAAGAEARQVTVERIIELTDCAVRVLASGEEICGRYLLDASGQGTLVGRHLNTRQTIDDPHLRKVAYFGHFEGVERLPGTEAGHPGIIICDEGWFWLIAIDERHTSIGFVAEPDLAKRAGIPANRMLAWAVSRCPVVRDRMAQASGETTSNQVLADFSYACRPYAGPGYFLIGDAAAFLDPIFSTGVTLAMLSGVEAARHTIAIIREGRNPAAARRQYIRYIDGGSKPLWRLIRQFYRHSFRELFLNGTGPMQVHKAVISVLAGQVFPRPAWCLRWRLRLFELCVRLNQYLPLVPRRRRFSLLASEPVEWPDSATGAQAYGS